MNRSRLLPTALATLVVVLVAAQLVPYGRRHTTPPDAVLAAFDTPATQRLAERACFDCHSNRTRWPWYASIAPMSWRIQHHVDEGREKLNFTAFDPRSKDVAEAAGEASETVTKGEMPPRDYVLMHPEARLSASERDALASGLGTMFAAFGEKEAGEGGAASGAVGAAGGERAENGARAERGEKGERGESAERERGEAKERGEDRD